MDNCFFYIVCFSLYCIWNGWELFLKTELISNVSHDLKTPLTSIISYIDLLKKENDMSETQKEYIEILEQKSQRLTLLIEDLVEASKVASGKISYNK